MNHTTILKKCLDELSCETPRIDYVKGMLETLIEMGGTPGVDSSPKLVVTGSTPVPPAQPVVEPGLPPPPNIGKIMEIAQKSQ